MSFSNARRLFALLVAVLVVCSFVAVPVAGVGDGTTLGDGFDGTSSSTDSDTTDSEDGASSDDTDETSSTGDTSTTDETEDDSDDGDTSTDGTDDGDTSTDDETDTNTTDEVRDTVERTADALDESTDTTTDTVDDTTETVEDTVDDTTDTVETTTEDSVETLSLGEALVSPASTDPADVVSPQLSTDESLQLDGTDGDGVDDTGADTDRASYHETAVADADDADDGHAVAATTTSGAGGQPVPDAPVGGAAISISMLAAMAALRTTPLVAGGVPTLGSISASISMPAILSKLRPFVFPLRYSRYDDSDPLEHEAREEVYEIVNESPGSYLSELSEEADLPLSTTRHHVRVLEREDLVSGAKLRGKRRFYPAYAEGVELAAALNDEATATIIDAIARLGAASVSDLADDIGRDPSTISHHLQRLEEDGIITREREGRAVMNKLSGEARTALEPDSTPRPGDSSSAIAGGAD
ncbi:winged helix-turn-helix transcriptional regulator [Natronomonas amylolytica]|uniref:winged helix-turn-helix transcriptional regulator n=1 Tax=Natronomonas amylolytica TaxID=3108498 RepID=UPI0030092650